MARFYYSRTKKTVEIPDHLAAEYERRRWYQRLPDHQPAGQDWEPDQVPRGNISEVLAWVGDNDLRRQSALTVERAGKNRSTLLDALADDDPT